MVGAAATGLVLAAGGLGLESDEGGFSKRLEFKAWKEAVPEEFQPRYAPIWEEALTRVGKRLPSEFMCEHRGNNFQQVQNLCLNYEYNYSESDWRAPHGDEVWAMHGLHDTPTMNYPGYRKCVAQGEEMNPPHNILEKLDIKDGRAYYLMKPRILEDYRDKQIIVNYDPIRVFEEDVPTEKWEEHCGQYKHIIWSMGYDHFNNFGKNSDWDAMVRGRIIHTNKIAEGRFVFPINALDFESVFRKDPTYFDPMVHAGVMFTIYYGNGYRVPNGVMDAIMESGIPPWQVICDFN
ncbi:hypothetical protein HYS00_03100 [Candidatus Microgenomates bacterium]|nr:hypothetical protein [Candidatus Microgenomates bacterium]